MARVSTADLAQRLDALTTAVNAQGEALSRIADNGDKLLAALERMATPTVTRVIEGRATVAAQIKAPAKALTGTVRRIEGVMTPVGNLAAGDRVRFSAATRTTASAKVMTVDGDKRKDTGTVEPIGAGNLAMVEGVVRGIAGKVCVTVEVAHGVSKVLQIWVRKDQEIERIATA
jgi:ABC-type transporter Mla subunit MlaD